MPTTDNKHDLPKNGVSIVFSGVYSLPEFEQIKKGLEGDHTSKWSIYFDDPWLTIARGASISHALRFECVADKAIVVETLADLDYLNELHDRTDLDWHKTFIRNLIDELCLLPIPEHTIKERGACWLNGHRIAIYQEYGTVAFLSLSEARDFSHRLSELVERLEFRCTEPRKRVSESQPVQHQPPND